MIAICSQDAAYSRQRISRARLPEKFRAQFLQESVRALASSAPSDTLTPALTRPVNDAVTRGHLVPCLSAAGVGVTALARELFANEVVSCLAGLAPPDSP